MVMTNKRYDDNVIINDMQYQILSNQEHFSADCLHRSFTLQINAIA